MHDIRVAIQALVRRPGTPVIIILTLALSIGATTTIFALVDSLLLRPLAAPHPEQLVTIEGPVGELTPWTYAIWQSISRRPELFGGVMAWNPTQMIITSSGEVTVANAVFASASFFTVLGAVPERGRLFAAGDEPRGGGPDGPVAVISHAFWMRRFGGDPAIVGRVVTLGTRRVMIVGVTRPQFLGPDVGRAFDFVMPLGLVSPATLDGRSTWWLNIMARLKPGQSLAQGEAALEAAQTTIRDEARPDGLSGKDLAQFNRDATFRLRAGSTGNSTLRGRYGRVLGILFAAVGVVMLVACANVANLMLVRAVSRTHEMSVRVAIGASRWQLVRALLAESGVLALIGAGLGLGLAQLGSRALVTQIASASTPVTLDLTPDLRVVAFSLALAIGTALLFGTAPAFRATRSDPTDALKTSGRTLARGGRLAGADGLVVMQIALSLVLIVAAGLLVRTFVTLTTQPLGFDADRLVAADLQFPGVPTDQVIAISEETRARVAALPGVASAALSLTTPMSGMVRRVGFEVQDGPPVTERVAGFVNCVSPEWFRTTGTPIQSGRDFTPADRGGMPAVVIVNEEFVHTFFNGANPLGRVIVSGTPGHGLSQMTVIGVVADSYYRSLRETLQAIAYVPIAQTASMPGMELTVRVANGPASALVKPISAAVGADSRLRSTTTTMSEQIAGTIRQERIVAWLSGALGGIALALASVGLYGVTRYSVESRRRELGIRLMLGSDPAGVVWLTLKRVALMIGGGLGAGAFLSLWATRYIATLLFGVRPKDPSTIATAIALLVIVSMLAAWRPVRRATRIDPLEVLREG